MSPVGGSGHDEWLLALIPQDTGVTTADLLRLSGLSRPTLTDLLARLRAEGAVLSEPAVPSGRRGRPAQRWRRPPPRGMFAAIALTRDDVRVRVADGSDQAVAERERPMNVTLDVRGALDCGLRLLHESLAELDRYEDSLTALVLGLPCPVGGDGDPQARGMMPGWVGVRPGEWLRHRLPGVRITVENDANLAAFGELTEGAGRGRSDLIYIKLAAGLGAALVVGGRLYRGATGLAGELGHVQINEMGHPCVCGARGCLAMEQYVAASHATGRPGPSAILDLFRRCDAGDAAAGRVLGHIGGLLGEQLGVLADMLDPECVVISTDDVPPHPAVLAGIRGGIRRTALPVVSDLPVIASTLGVRAEAIGGIALARAASHRHTD
ncbi:ROK family transcriptional regulator [Actinoallomurus vinaceus]|uniref:ROK family transcriptional regulator n=1 Tax=Actinoallomurus vinaceus TaxID=1080074 RepID=A0ABP8U860_9ACTN